MGPFSIAMVFGVGSGDADSLPSVGTGLPSAEGSTSGGSAGCSDGSSIVVVAGAGVGGVVGSTCGVVLGAG